MLGSESGEFVFRRAEDHLTFCKMERERETWMDLLPHPTSSKSDLQNIAEVKIETKKRHFRRSLSGDGIPIEYLLTLTQSYVGPPQASVSDGCVSACNGAGNRGVS